MVARVHITGYALVLGALGQYLLLDEVFPKSPMMWLIVMATIHGLPGGVVCLISFCTQQPFRSLKFRDCILFALWWYAISSIFSVALHFVLRSPSDSKFALMLVALVMVSFGWLAFIPLLRVCQELLRIHTYLVTETPKRT